MTKPSMATMLVALAESEGVEFWHDADGRAFATVPKPDHREHYRLRSTVMRTWLSGVAYHQLGVSLGSEAMYTALTTLEGIAIHDGDQHPVFTRVAGREGRIYLDLANDKWQAVEVTSDGWRVVNNPPVRFRRAPGMKSLPLPLQGGRLDSLRPLLNVRSEDWPLFVAWLVQAARDRGPYPVLAIYGEQGSAKSTGARLLRSIIDPNGAPLRSPPKEIRDLAIAATNGWIVVLDNLSYLPQWLSDGLCVLSTGGGFATRSLYTDDEEAIFSFRRPVIINGIAEVAERGDLIDRCIPLTLEVITEDRRLTEDEVDAHFARVHPFLLGAVLDGVSTALRRLPDIHLARKPRMADFATWVVAAEPALGSPEGVFLRAYTRARIDAVESSIETSTVGHWLTALAEAGGFKGTATELFDRADEKLRRASDWPKNARSLSGELRRLVPGLRAIGVEVRFDREANRSRRRLIVIALQDNSGGGTSAASAASSSDSVDPRSSDANEEARTHSVPLSDAEQWESQIRVDDVDGTDARSAAFSNLTSCAICGRTDLCRVCGDETRAPDAWPTAASVGEVHRP